MEQYPKWLYHPSFDPQIAHSPDDHEALGEEWAESPDFSEVSLFDEIDEEEKPKPKAKKNANR